MKKLFLATVLVYFLSSISLSADHRGTLPPVGEPFNWNEVPVVCGPHQAVMDKMERMNLHLLHASFGKKGANPDGEVVFMVLYYVNNEGTSTAAVLTMPNDPSACVLYISYDVTLAPKKKNFQ